MKNNRSDKYQGQGPDQLMYDEERHRRLWLQHALKTPMPLPRHNLPTANNKNKPDGTSS
jgi:hypothetical protein